MWAYNSGGYGAGTGYTGSGDLATGSSDTFSRAAGYINTMYGGNTGGNTGYVSSGANPYGDMYGNMGSWGIYG